MRHLLLVLTLAVPAAAQTPAMEQLREAAGQPRGEFEFDYYMLALSWQPTFCLQNQDKPECVAQTPNSYQARNLVLHGLWPNRSDDPRHTYGYCGVSQEVQDLDRPESWDRMPPLELSPQTVVRLRELMPGYASSLERHEWYKHGICSGMTPDAYYRLTLSLVVAMGPGSQTGRLLSASAGGELVRADLEAALARDLGPQPVQIRCDRVGDVPALAELRIALVADLDEGIERDEVLPAEAASARSACPERFSLPGVR